MIKKAEEILRTTEVVSNRAVGFAGECPEANWALSVIIVHDPKPTERLVKLAEQSSPAGFFMCLLAVRFVDPLFFEKYISEHAEALKNVKSQICIQIGCSQVPATAEEALSEIKRFPRDQILCDPIPELYETVRTSKMDFEIPKK